MKKYKEFPDEGELVVIEVKSVNPHSVFADLEEYNKEGMMHISEISRSWVRDIKKHVKEGEKNVAQVIEVDEEDNTIGLSLKRVNDKQKREKMQKWNKEQKADKFLKKVSEEVDQDLDQIYEKVAFPFQKKFENTFDGFEKAVIEPEIVEDIIEDKYINAVQSVARENISMRRVKMEGKLKIEVPSSNGLNIIKDALDLDEDNVKISYISAPDYKIETWSRNKNLCKKKMKKAVKQVEEKIENQNGTFSFEKQKK